VDFFKYSVVIFTVIMFVLIFDVMKHIIKQARNQGTWYLNYGKLPQYLILGLIGGSFTVITFIPQNKPT